MALVINDRVKETTTTTGTGAVSLGGAVTGFETFAAGIGNSNTVYYCIAHQDQAEFEVGLGTLDGDSSDLTRTTVISSSNSDSAVDFSAGTKDVFCTIPASKMVFEDASDNVSISGNFQAANITATTAFVPDAADGASLGTTSLEFSDLFLADGGTIKFGNDQDINITHVADTGLTTNGDFTVGYDLTVSGGVIDVKNTGAQSEVRFYCESSNAHYAAIKAPAHSDFSGNTTLTLPATTDTIAGIASTQTFTNKTITNSNNTVGLATLDIDGGTDIGANLADADLFIVDDGAGGTNRKMAASRIATYVGASAGAFAIANLDIDGGTDIGADLADADLIIVDDGAGGTNRKAALSRVKTYLTSAGFSTEDPTALAIALG